MSKDIVAQAHAPAYSMQDIERMGIAIARSGLFGIKTPEQATALMLLAQAQGRHPASVAMDYDIIQNRPALRSQAALSRFQESGGKIKYLVRTDKEVSAEFSHPQGGTLVVSWDMARAAKMGLSSRDQWQKQPMVMLTWRVVAEGVRACFPACLGGSYLVEEVQDFDSPKSAPRDITPTIPTAENPMTIATHLDAHGEVVNVDDEIPFGAPEAVPCAPSPAAEKKQYTAEKKQYKKAAAPHPADDSTVISEAQGKRFYAIAKSTGAPDEAIKTWLTVNFGWTSTRQITKALYEEVCERVKTEVVMREPGQEG